MAHYKKYEENKIGKDYAVGDIHGNKSALMKLLKRVNFDFDKDRLFSVGDLTDRGLENIEVIELLKEKWFFAVRGNHEDIIIDIKLDTVEEVYGNKENRNGNGWFFNESDEKRLEIIKTFKSLPYAIQVGEVGIVHAYPDSCWKKTLNAIKNNDQLKINNYIWNRTISKLVAIYNYSLVKEISNIDYVVVGHQIQKKAQIIKNIVFLDTGYFAGGELSLINLKTKEITTIKNYELY